MKRLVLTPFLAAAIAVTAVDFAPQAAFGQDDGALQDPPRRRRGGRGPAAGPPAPPPVAEVKVEAEPEEPPRWFAITGARVHTVSGPVLDGVTVLCKNGRINAIGRSVEIPEGAEVLDAAGYRLYPGLVSVRMTGLLGGGDPDDSTDTFALALAVARAAGITTGVTGETAAKLTLDTLDDMVVKRNLFESLTYTTRNPQGRRRVRQDLDRVRDHLRDVAAHAEAKRRDPDAAAPDDKWIRGDFEKYMRLIKGEAVALVDASTAHEILGYCELADRYGIRFVVRGGYEAWTVAKEMAAAGMSAIISPREEVTQDERSNRPTGATIETAAILHAHGVPVAFIPVGGLFGPGTGLSFGGLAGRDQAHLAMAAAFAVRGGLPNDVAVRGLTLDAARILGIDARVGSIEVGKDADFVITDGELLHYMTHARWTVINGRIVYDKQKDTIYDHIRPDGDRDSPPPDDWWPRRLGDLDIEAVAKAADDTGQDAGEDAGEETGDAGEDAGGD